MSVDFIHNYHELWIYQTALKSAMRIFEAVQTFPEFERLLLTNQLLRSSRSVCANLAEAWQKRRYKGAFVAKLNDVEAEAAETQTWIELATRCGYLDKRSAQELYHAYREVLSGAARLIENADAWVVR